MIHKDASEFFGEDLDGEVQEQLDGTLLWFKSWIGDACNIDEGDPMDVTYDLMCEASAIIRKHGYHSGPSQTEHDYASVEFWKGTRPGD